MQAIRFTNKPMSIISNSNRSLFDLDLLRALTVVADCASFTQAATQLHSTQSTISQKIRRLEEMVGHKLLDRSMRGVYPTDAGLILLSYARQMLVMNDQLHEALSGVAVTVVIRLGVPEDFSSGKTMRRLAAFNRRYPQVKLEVTSGLSSDLSSSYDQGELDLILIKQRQHARRRLLVSLKKRPGLIVLNIHPFTWTLYL